LSFPPEIDVARNGFGEGNLIIARPKMVTKATVKKPAKTPINIARAFTIMLQFLLF
jgi:hypothetical protein